MTTLTEVRWLQREVAAHKSAIAQHRKALRRDAAALDWAWQQHESECQRLGIRLTTTRQPSTGTGDIHSHADRTTP